MNEHRRDPTLTEVGRVLRLLGTSEWRLRAALRLARSAARPNELAAAMGDSSTRVLRDITDMRREGWIEKIVLASEPHYRLSPRLQLFMQHLAPGLQCLAAATQVSRDTHRTWALQTGRAGQIRGLLTGRRGRTMDELTEHTGLTVTNVRNIVTRLHRAGVVESCGARRWRAVEVAGGR